ncbi:hypothetical protein [Undibacterium sp. SXout20W]|uniref:hypothetical protein n=1 Tax=Undibacterium sp. SXout20W TaxID=3413051 RepID=UPI003BF0D574
MSELNHVIAYISGEKSARALIDTMQICFVDPDSLFKAIQAHIPAINEKQSLGKRGFNQHSPIRLI